MAFLFVICVCAWTYAQAPQSTELSAPVDIDSPAKEDSSGPTILFDYGLNPPQLNTVESFMYFVPLIAPTCVVDTASDDNNQQARICSWHGKISRDSFNVSCLFEMTGDGWYRNSFDTTEMICEYSQYVKPPKPLKYMLEYIKFEGPGQGKIEVKGKIKDSVWTAEQVKVDFNADGCKSPVLIGLYDVKCVDGKYVYENRLNEMVVRVDSLTFTRTKGVPKMAVQLASIASDEKSEGLWSGVKAAIANLFLITPMPITQLGNDAMLDFGLALTEKQPAFTFPSIEEKTRMARTGQAQLQTVGFINPSKP